MPGRLVGVSGLHGPVPKRLAPIFRDREELSSGVDLSEEIKQALADSETLLVVCSPAAAASKWVNREIEQFRELGKDRIYCVIVDGDPNASSADAACFPPALLQDEQHELIEPLAADVRPWADGKALARSKLAAALLGVRLDDLRQREKKRKRKIQAFAIIAMFAVFVLLAFSVQSRLAEQEAQLARAAQQASAEKMLASFLDQAEKLRDVADLETRKSFQDVMTRYLAAFDEHDLSQQSRRQLGVMLANRGIILRDENQPSQAMEVFKQARQVLQALVDELGDDPESLFELSQVEYWIGQVYVDLGQAQQAAPYYSAYAAISEKLHSIEPQNADWTMEAAYAQSNLGALKLHVYPFDPMAAIQHYRTALELNQEAALLDQKYEHELADSHADLADAWIGICKMDEAMTQRLKTVELAETYYRQSPANNRLKQDYGHALSGLSILQRKSGQNEKALENLQRSLQIQEELVSEDPQNMIKRWSLLRKMAEQAKSLEVQGSVDASWEISLGAESAMRQFLAEHPVSIIDYQVDFAVFLKDFADRAFRANQLQAGRRLLNESIVMLEQAAETLPNNKTLQSELVSAYFYYWENHQGVLPEAVQSVDLALKGDVSDLATCLELGAASRQALLAGDREKAQEFVDRLLGHGFREAEFLRYCSRYGLC